MANIEMIDRLSNKDVSDRESLVPARRLTLRE